MRQVEGQPSAHYAELESVLRVPNTPIGSYLTVFPHGGPYPVADARSGLARVVRANPLTRTTRRAGKLWRKSNPATHHRRVELDMDRVTDILTES